jgi:hypothetical protein
MKDLTRRKFLTGAPAVAVGVVVGVAVAPKGASPARPILTINKMPTVVDEVIRGPTVGDYDIESDRIVTEEMVLEWWAARIGPPV